MELLLYVVSVISCFCLTNVQGFSSKINNGMLADRKDFKYLVGIVSVDLFWEDHCTGGIISEKFILTAAHCMTVKTSENLDGSFKRKLKDLKRVIVYANTDGMLKISTNAVKRKVIRAYLTPKYFENGIDDIAILELEENLDIVKNLLRKLALPRRAARRTAFGSYRTYDNVNAVLAGFGRDEVGTNDKSLKKMNAIVMSPIECELSLIFMCAKANPADKKRPEDVLGGCDGDSGAPLVDAENTVIGVYKGNLHCNAKHDDPDIYMRVSAYMDFINDVLNGEASNKRFTSHDLEILK